MALGLNRAKIGRKIALYAVICGLLGVTQFLAPASLTLGMFQSKLATKPVSGDIVVVGIDSDSINKIGRWPWPRDKQAELLQAIDNANPKSVFVDIGYQGVTDPVADATLRRTFENMNSPVTIAALAMKSENGESTTIFSHPDAVGNIKPVSVFFPYLFGVVWSLPYRVETNRGQIKSLSADIAGVKTNSISEYRLDLSYDPETIRILSASDVIDNPSTRLQMGGKTVVLGVTDPTQNDIHAMPGWGQRPGVLFRR
jgi:CHASE2 domain-containing sensor protein